MGQILRLRQPQPPMRIIFGSALIRRLIAHASALTCIPAEEIAGSGRIRDIVWTRCAIAMVARENGRTLHQIAECLNRDHTTIINALRIGKTIQDGDFALLLEMLRAEAAR